MRKLVVASLALLCAPVLRASALEAVDPALVAAVDKVLATMPADFYQVEPAAAQQLMENAKPLVLDLREASELSAAGWIAGSTHIPIRDLPKKLAALPENKAAPILTYCKGGLRGGMAVTILRMWGYTNVRTIKNGLDGWEKAGLKVEKKS